MINVSASWLSLRDRTPPPALSLPARRPFPAHWAFVSSFPCPPRTRCCIRGRFQTAPHSVFGKIFVVRQGCDIFVTFGSFMRVSAVSLWHVTCYNRGGAWVQRSEERRVGKEVFSTCRICWAPAH